MCVNPFGPPRVAVVTSGTFAHSGNVTFCTAGVACSFLEATVLLCMTCFPTAIAWLFHTLGTFNQPISERLVEVGSEVTFRGQAPSAGRYSTTWSLISAMKMEPSCDDEGFQNVP